MANSNSENLQDNGIIEEVIVTAERVNRGSLNADQNRALADVKQMLQQTSETIGDLNALSAAGGQFLFTGATATLDWNLRTPATAFQIATFAPDASDFSLRHIYLPNNVPTVWNVPATDLKFNLFDSVLTKSFSCGGFNYLRIANADASGYNRGDVLQVTGTTNANGTANTIKATDRTTAGIYVCGTKGETTTPVGGEGLALLTGSFPFDITAVLGAPIQYASGGALTLGPGLGFYIAYVEKARTASTPVSSWGLLGVNSKFGNSLLGL